jgi:precorrin-6A/cobalt-precorrin-6A reductase
VFLTTGIRELDAFRDCPGSGFVIRTITPPQLSEPWPHANFVQARGPFSVEAELQLLRDHNISLLVTKNSGGSATAPKLHAARQLDLPVLMTERPELPLSKTVSEVDAALAWITSFQA